jgi:hypothetical protein
MNKIILAIAVSFLIIPVAGVSAQMMYGAPQNTSGAYPNMMGYPGYGTATTSQPLDAGEAAGQAIAQKLQAKTVACADLSQDNYESLGDYYMGLMMGSSHDAMEQSITKVYGADYLKSMHIAMGERFSGCNVNVAFPAGMMGFGPMMGGYNMMGNWGPSGNQGGQGNWQGRGYSMMGWGFPGMMGGYYGFGIGNTVFMVILWALAIVGLVALIKLIINKNKK